MVIVEDKIKKFKGGAEMRELVAKQWIERTKKELKEELREERIKAIFEVIFGFQPTWIEWVSDPERKIVAEAQVESFKDVYIMGRRVVSVKFRLKEDPLQNVEDENWEMSEYSRGPWIIYKWKKRMRGFLATVEIDTEIE